MSDTRPSGSADALGYIVDCRTGPSDYAFFWGPNGGYTSNLREAGLYTEDEYRQNAGHAPWAAAWVPRERVEAVERRSALFVDLGVGYEWQRREDLKTERQAATLMAVMRHT